MPASRPSLVGAFGQPAPPLSPGALARPERILRFYRIQKLLWVARIGIVVGVLALLLLARGVVP